MKARRRRLPVLLAVALLAGRALPAGEPGYLPAPLPLRLPAGVQLSAVAGLAVDSTGALLIFHRAEPPVLVFDGTGRHLRSFGTGLFKAAHGLRVDAADNVWATDMANHTVVKFSPDGRVLLTLGERDRPGDDPAHFNRPADIAFAANGDFFVADGYGNSRIVKFDRTGRFLKAWGHRGKGEGEFNLPHAVGLDSKGLLYVADRENNRLQVFDQEGRFVRQFGGFAPYGLFISADDRLFVADGRAHRVLLLRLDGTVHASWGTLGSEPGNFNLPHALTGDAQGAVYVGEVPGKRVQKFVPRPAAK